MNNTTSIQTNHSSISSINLMHISGSNTSTSSTSSTSSAKQSRDRQNEMLREKGLTRKLVEDTLHNAWREIASIGWTFFPDSRGFRSWEVEQHPFSIYCKQRCEEHSEKVGFIDEADNNFWDCDVTILDRSTYSTLELNKRKIQWIKHTDTLPDELLRSMIPFVLKLTVAPSAKEEFEKHVNSSKKDLEELIKEPMSELVPSIKEIKNLLILNGVNISTIEERAEPGQASFSGFLQGSDKLLDVLYYKSLQVSALGMTHLLFAAQFRRIRQTAVLSYAFSSISENEYLQKEAGFNRERHQIISKAREIMNRVKQMTPHTRMNKGVLISPRYSFRHPASSKIYQYRVTFLPTYLSILLDSQYPININPKEHAEYQEFAKNVNLPLTKEDKIYYFFYSKLLEKVKKCLEPDEQLLVVDRLNVPDEFYLAEPIVNDDSVCNSRDGQIDIFLNPVDRRHNLPRWTTCIRITNANTGKTMTITDGDIGYIAKYGFWQNGRGFEQMPLKAWQVLTGT